MKKRILSFMLACTLLFSTDGLVHAVEMTDEGQATSTEIQEEKSAEEDQQKEDDLSEEQREEKVTENNTSQIIEEEVKLDEEMETLESEVQENKVQENQPQKNEVPALGAELEKPEAPTLKVESCRYDHVQLSWNATAMQNTDRGYYIYLLENNIPKIVAEYEYTPEGYIVYPYSDGVKKEALSETEEEADSLTYTYTNVENAKTYQFAVAAYVKQEEEEQVSDISNYVTATPKLQAISLTSVTAKSYNQAQLVWDKTTDEPDSYEVYRKEQGSSDYSKLAEVKNTSYIDSTLQTGKQYFYKVRSVKKLTNGTAIYSDYSQEKQVQTSFAAVKINVACISYNSNQITWNKIDGASGYQLYRSNSKGGTYKKIAELTNGAATSYTDKKLTTGNTYYYKLRAYSGTGSSKVYASYSNVGSKKVVPASPIISSVKAKNYNTIQIKWKKCSGASGYVLYRSTSPNKGYKKIATIKNAKTLSYTNKKLASGKTYYYKLRAYRTVGKKKVYGNYSTIKSCGLEKVTLKVSSSSITIKKGEKKKITATVTPKATVKWSSGNKKVAKVNSKGQITGTGIGTTKIYAKANGLTKTINVKVVPIAPKLRGVSSKNYNTLTIKWNKVKNADGYAIYQSTSKNGKYKKIATVKASKGLSYTNEKLKTGKKYYYKVRAYQTVKKSKLYSSYSNIKAGVPIPSKVTGLKAEPQDSNKIKLTWNKVSGAKSYTIYRSTSKKGSYKVIKTGYTQNSYANSKLENGKRYYYKVAAIRGKTSGKLSGYVTAKAASLSVSNTSLTIQQGFQQTITATASPNATVKWSSSNSYIVSVNANGVITGVGVGSAKIYAKANGITRTIKVKVKRTLNGIDVSKWQGEIDFNAVKNAGFDVVMIRVYNGYTEDPYFESNYQKARAAGLNIGVYYYTYATTVQQVQADAITVLQILKGRSLQYPVTIDMEDASLLGLTNATRTDILWTFCSTIQQYSSYRYALYANLNWLNNYFENHRLIGMPIWIARYCDPSLGHRYTGNGNVFMWQYTSQGTIPGINGFVDMNYVF